MFRPRCFGLKHWFWFLWRKHWSWFCTLLQKVLQLSDFAHCYPLSLHFYPHLTLLENAFYFPLNFLHRKRLPRYWNFCQYVIPVQENPEDPLKPFIMVSHIIVILIGWFILMKVLLVSDQIFLLEYFHLSCKETFLICNWSNDQVIDYQGRLLKITQWAMTSNFNFGNFQVWHFLQK